MLHGREDIHLHRQRDTGGHVGVGSVLPDTESQREHGNTEDQTDGNPYHMNAQIVEPTSLGNDVVIEEQTGNQRRNQRDTGGREHDKQNDGDAALVFLQS